MKYLEEALPLSMWEEAERQAARSTLRNFKTGSVIFNKKDYNVLARGCSYIPLGDHVKSVHAEYEALRNFQLEYTGAKGTGILIVCIGKSGNYAFSARPCGTCAYQLQLSGIETVYYAERINDGSWLCNVETPKELLSRTDKSRTSYNKYAKEMRIVA